MSEFYIPKTGTVTVGKVPYRLFRGVHDISDKLANSHEANDFGIKPLGEMTDDEWRLSGRVKADWEKAEKAKAEAMKADAKASTTAAATK